MADVSVRPASAADVIEIARVQRDVWLNAYETVLPQAVRDSLDVRTIAAGWRRAVEQPPTQRHHVLVATEGSQTVGFVAFGPDADQQPGDPDSGATAAISALLVEQRWGRRGHGSRLLAATADIAREEGVLRLVAWVPAADTSSLEFYRGTGWQADGLQRGLDTGAGTVSELRLHTSLAE